MSLKERSLGGLPRRIIQELENPTIPLVNYFLTFIFAVMLRDFLEAYSQQTNHLNLPTNLLGLEVIHFILFYMMVAMLLILIFHWATKVPIKKVLRVILPAFILLLFAPLFDLTITLGQGINLRYLQPDYDINLLHSYFTYAGGFAGISLGIKIEVLMLLISSYIYFRVKHVNILRSLIFIILLYSILFICSTLPFFIKWIQTSFGYVYQFSNEMMIHFYLIADCILLFLVGYFADKQTALILLKDIRPLRIIFYELMLCLGMAIALRNGVARFTTQLHFYNDSIINLILAMISIFFACFFSIVCNNVADVEIDKIANPNRPLQQANIDRKIYELLGFIALALALFYALMISLRALLLISVPIASYYIYSMPPLRIKRIILISKLAISLSALALIILGYTLIADNVIGFPDGLYLIFLILLTFSANFIDLKDISGDRAANIMTLPVRFGEQKAKRVIGLSFLLTTLSFYYLLGNVYWLIGLFALGILQYALINRKNYHENSVLVVTNLSFFTLICLMLY